eukprot:PhM_4_TR4862/c0_g2_i1/m.93384
MSSRSECYSLQYDLPSSRRSVSSSRISETVRKVQQLEQRFVEERKRRQMLEKELKEFVVSGEYPAERVKQIEADAKREMELAMMKKPQPPPLRPSSATSEGRAQSASARVRTYLAALPENVMAEARRFEQRQQQQQQRPRGGAGGGRPPLIPQQRHVHPAAERKPPVPKFSSAAASSSSSLRRRGGSSVSSADLYVAQKRKEEWLRQVKLI